jgi:hypothetical protein
MKFIENTGKGMNVMINDFKTSSFDIYRTFLVGRDNSIHTLTDMFCKETSGSLYDIVAIRKDMLRIIRVINITY